MLRLLKLLENLLLSPVLLQLLQLLLPVLLQLLLVLLVLGLLLLRALAAETE